MHFTYSTYLFIVIVNNINLIESELWGQQVLFMLPNNIVINIDKVACQ